MPKLTDRPLQSRTVLKSGAFSFLPQSWLSVGSENPTSRLWDYSLRACGATADKVACIASRIANYRSVRNSLSSTIFISYGVPFRLWGSLRLINTSSSRLMLYHYLHNNFDVLSIFVRPTDSKSVVECRGISGGVAPTITPYSAPLSFQCSLLPEKDSNPRFLSQIQAYCRYTIRQCI